MSMCSGPAWAVDDLTPCYLHWYIETLPYAFMLGVSVLLFAVKFVPRVYGSTVSYFRQRSPALIQHNEPAYGSIDVEPTTTTTSADFEDNCAPKKDLVVTTLVPRSTTDRLCVAIEFVTVITLAVLSYVALLNSSLSEEYHNFPYALWTFALFWSYNAVLAVVRVVYMRRGSVPSGGLWYHNTFMYLFAWAFSWASVYSARLHPFNEASKMFHTVVFLLCTVLFIATFSTSTGNRPVVLYSTGGNEPSTEPKSSLFSLISFSWINPLIWEGYWRPLNTEDIWDLREDDHAYQVLKQFRKIPRVRNNKPVNFAWRMCIHFRREIALAGFWALFYSFTTFGPSMLLKKILEYVDDPTIVPSHVAWLYVFGIFVFTIVDSVANNQALFIGRRICIRMRAIIIGEVYAKALRRREVPSNAKEGASDTEGSGDESEPKPSGSDSEKSSDQAKLGTIINLMAVDAFKISEICGYLHFFVASVLTIIIAIAFLYFILSWSAFIGALVAVATMPLNYWFSKKFGQYQNELMAVTDDRIEKTNELLQSIRIIKYFAWEQKFGDGVLEIREKELQVLRKRYVLWAFGALIWFTSPMLIAASSFASYTLLQKQPLTAPIAFTALSLFNILRFPLDQLADMISNVVQSKVSVDRVENFLNEKETSKYQQLSSPRGPGSPTIGFENATFGWSDSSDNDAGFMLRDLNINFQIGKLNLIVGPTGSGKTSILMALLGEMELKSGKVFLPSSYRDDVLPDADGLCDTVAYCAQQPWLLNDTVRNNILFASEWDEARYKAVIDACALTRDLEILEHGDETLVGEKGITLSGGQKQRISLARAFYSRSKHLILDDCLSAVDAHTALWIYRQCIIGPVAKNRTLVLVSHNVALTAPEADFVIMVNNGRVTAQGAPQTLVSQGHLEEDMLRSGSVTRAPSEENLASLSAEQQKLAVNVEGENEDTLGESKAAARNNEEVRSTGTVSKGVYLSYLNALGGPVWWCWLLFLFCLHPALNVLQSWWVRVWTVSMDYVVNSLSSMGITSTSALAGLSTALSMSHIQNATVVQEVGANDLLDGVTKGHSTIYYICIYALIGIAFSMFSTFKEYILFMAGIRASKKMFEELLGSILHAKTRFFDSTPVGRIMNRFSKDMEGVDQDLSPVGAGAVHCLVSAITTAIVIAIVTPKFLVAGIFIFALYWAIGVFYLNTSRELKRLDSITKSPIYQQFGETLVGISTIRAYGDQRRFVQENMMRVDENNRPFFYMWMSNRWLAFRVDNAAALVSFFAASFVLLSLDRLDAGLAGLSLSYALAFNENVLWIVRLYSQLEMNMNSVERVREYVDVEQEPSDTTPPPRTTWPERGEVEFKDLSLRYAPDLPRVIKNVSFSVPGCSKVGIVGRTGAGKSTIITALFRFIEAETGSIVIDGVDIASIGLESLRRAIAIIPQDPTLFSGTVRSNLDPFEEYSDESIFEALRRVHLITYDELSANKQASTSDSGSENVNQFLDLSSTVTEGGKNLSQGQRQLMCLARSLLKAPKILLLDEATASIDYDTDAQIQKTIREEFQNTTILTIAHRLRSIVDYDRILVMDAGEAKEYDHPHNLLQDTSTIFYDMCLNSGELDILQDLAQKAYNM